ncbi:MAG TPA: GNAT family N-acetyltransferase [Aggregatilinea sp.]|jgi:ribosomal protein S18 acetylase RimI-like enzyme|uniref:GNAT family N-acetyltransferase n=1 Tax=Aggregatilinea sp. TaxID=2806333 RepID=UPI002BB2CD4D|nr:GNAT family N-acetyltransferase [Aggregatilinea sp.]HML22868.1 GNAT family N-acetyltransferase [Aggregatilinea sp.]
MMGIQVRAARLVDLPGVAAALQDSFSDKLRIIFSRDPSKVRALIEASYTGPIQRGYDGVLVAERDGRIVGTAVLEPIYYTTRETRNFENLAVRELGMPRMLWTSFMLWLIGHTPEPGEAYIGDLGVIPDYQGQGVGQLLLDHAETWAREHGRDSLTLWVAAGNARAIHVYEKAGMKLVRKRSSALTMVTLGIRQWHFMSKALKEPQPEPEEVVRFGSTMSEEA